MSAGGVFVHSFALPGIMLAGGSGRELANMVVDGTTSVDMFGFDANRFHPDCTKNNAWVLGLLCSPLSSRFLSIVSSLFPK